MALRFSLLRFSDRLCVKRFITKVFLRYLTIFIYLAYLAVAGNLIYPVLLHTMLKFFKISSVAFMNSGLLVDNK